MRNISTGKIKQFYSADQLTKESIRNDVLLERYADLQAELSDLEEMLNISNKETDSTLFSIIESLIETIKNFVPEIDEQPLEEGVEEQDEKTKIFENMKKRELAARSWIKQSEEFKFAEQKLSEASDCVQNLRSYEDKKTYRDNVKIALNSLSKVTEN
tara:strand:- start:24 stop:497 length:474 start_codon:yes stop_codon:yes gene_type:complete